jgi:hypothetical protein
MREYIVGAILGGFVFLATRSKTTAPLFGTARKGPLPPLLMPPPAQSATHFASRGIPILLIDALSKAPLVPNKAADAPEDTVQLVVDATKTTALAEKAVQTVNLVSPGIIHLIAADTGLEMTSGVTRVIFTAHYPKTNVSIKLVATFEKGVLVYIRPYSIVPDVLDPLVTTADLQTTSFKCFPPIVDVGACSSSSSS